MPSSALASRAALIGLGVTLGVVAPAGGTPMPRPPMERVSISSDGLEGDAGSFHAAVSPDGRWVAFESFAGNLVPDDHNPDAGEEIFVRDRAAGSTARVSLHDNGRELRAHAHFPAISADGRFVAFETHDELDDTPHPGATGVYVRDRDADGDGVFDEPTEGASATRLMSVNHQGIGNTNKANTASISSDGRHVAFTSFADNLVPGNEDAEFDVYVRDRDTDSDGVFDDDGGTATVLISAAPDGQPGNGASGSNGAPAPMTPDGRFVAFVSNASNLVGGDDNALPDAFVHDRDADGDGVFDEPGEVANEIVSVASDGESANGLTVPVMAISPDGRFVTFSSEASNLAPGDEDGALDVFVRDRLATTTTRVSAPVGDGKLHLPPEVAGPLGAERPRGDSYASAVSGDGRFVAFDSRADDLVAGDTRPCGTSLTGMPALDAPIADLVSVLPVGLSGLTPPSCSDVFLHDRDVDGDGVFDEQGATRTTMLSTAPDGASGDGDSRGPAITADAAAVVFSSQAKNLVTGDGNAAEDVFLQPLR